MKGAGSVNVYGKDDIMLNPSREIRYKDLVLECLYDLLMCGCLRVAGLHKESRTIITICKCEMDKISMAS